MSRWPAPLMYFTFTRFLLKKSNSTQLCFLWTFAKIALISIRSKLLQKTLFYFDIGNEVILSWIKTDEHNHRIRIRLFRIGFKFTSFLKFPLDRWSSLVSGLCPRLRV